MNLRRAACGTAVGVALLLGNGAVCAAADRNPARPLRVSVIDRTNTDRDVVIHAMQVVSTIYRRIDVEIRWGQWDDPKADTTCRHLKAVIDPGTMVRGSALPQTVMGFAAMSPEGTSDIAFILYDRVRENAARSSVRVADLLGHVIAHELGHLLLPYNSHTKDGIMRGRWERPDFALAARGLLLFDEPQGVLIRRNVAPTDAN